MKKGFALLSLVLLLCQVLVVFQSLEHITGKIGAEVAGVPDAEDLYPSAPSRANGDVAVQFHMDEGGGTSIRDTSGNAIHGTLHTGGESTGGKWTDGIRGKALEFDGENDHVTTAYKTGDLVEATWELWFLLEKGTPRDEMNFIDLTSDFGKCQELGLTVKDGEWVLKLYIQEYFSSQLTSSTPISEVD